MTRRPWCEPGCPCDLCQPTSTRTVWGLEANAHGVLFVGVLHQQEAERYLSHHLRTGTAASLPTGD